MLFSLLFALATAGVGIALHVRARQFVRSRLRYVDAAHKRIMPWMAGGATTMAVAIVGSVLPVVGLPTALVLGIAVGTGVAAGSKDVRLAHYRVD